MSQPTSQPLPETLTALAVIFDGKPVILTRLGPAVMESLLDRVEDDLRRMVLTRTDVADRVAGAFAAGRFRTLPDRQHLAALLLWLAVRGQADIAERVRFGSTVVWAFVEQLGTTTTTITFEADDVTAELAALERAVAAEDLAEPSLPSPAAAPARAGHGPKIAAAVRALQERGLLPEGLRPNERDRRVLAELRRGGYAPEDLPSRKSIARHLRLSTAHTRRPRCPKVAEMSKAPRRKS